MVRPNKIARLLLIGALVMSSGVMVGCTKKPNNEETSKLEESRSAAESAERKLAELRQERIKLEKELQDKQGELKKNEQVKDSLQNVK